MSYVVVAKTRQNVRDRRRWNACTFDTSAVLGSRSETLSGSTFAFSTRRKTFDSQSIERAGVEPSV